MPLSMAGILGYDSCIATFDCGFDAPRAQLAEVVGTKGTLSWSENACRQLNHRLSLYCHCLSLCSHCLSVRCHCLSLCCHRLSLCVYTAFQCLYKDGAPSVNRDGFIGPDDPTKCSFTVSVTGHPALLLLLLLLLLHLLLLLLILLLRSRDPSMEGEAAGPDEVASRCAQRYREARGGTGLVV